jgi:hypothetical protein
MVCGGEKKMFLRFLNFDSWRGGRLSGRPFCSRLFRESDFYLNSLKFANFSQVTDRSICSSWFVLPARKIFGRLPRSSNLQDPVIRSSLDCSRRERGGRTEGARGSAACGGGRCPCRSVVYGPQPSCLNDNVNDKRQRGPSGRPQRLTPAGGWHSLAGSVACCQ